jgi:hypothetical protein
MDAGIGLECWGRSVVNHERSNTAVTPEWHYRSEPKVHVRPIAAAMVLFLLPTNSRTFSK